MKETFHCFLKMKFRIWFKEEKIQTKNEVNDFPFASFKKIAKHMCGNFLQAMGAPYARMHLIKYGSIISLTR